MAKLTIDKSLLSSIVYEVGPLVSSISGWDLELHSMRARVLSKDQGYEEIVENKLRLLGLQENPEQDIISRTVEYLVENNVLAAYEPLSQELLVIRENVDDSNLDGLKLILGHELTHRGQHVNHPAVFEAVNHILVSMIKEMESGESHIQKMRTYFEEVQPLMVVIESHARYVQEALHQRYFPQAKIERHFTLPVLLFRVLGYGKVAQYTEGLPQVSAAMQKGSIDQLFRGLAS